ncbi:AMP-binding protein [Pseudomonas cavernicola]|uniref:AMP-binding protein n=1 Tax=Pseudomonas cavernicola TaxID=2320866 RepID=A0A418XL16_9PSED|nr:acyl-CoA synthetase family protein [Pseudomonas cavernicola]RJG13162.1 AMP-binding protein [Pseudomonas cavernicola]
MNWLDLEHLLLAEQPARPVTREPTLLHGELREQALCLAAGLQARGVRRLAVHLDDAAELAIALLGAWRAGVSVLLPADLQAQTRQRLNAEVDLWLSDQPGDASLPSLLAEPLPGALLALDHCTLTLCTSGSSGEPKLIGKSLRQLSNEVQALERLWGAELGDACIIGSVAAQHIYGLLFRVLWPLCAGRLFLRHAQPFPEDLQRTSLSLGRRASVASADEPVFNAAACAKPAAASSSSDFAWVASPALLKRMGDNLDWPALRRVRRVFSSGGALPLEAAQQLQENLGQWPTEIFGSSETGGIAWRQGASLWQPFADVQLSLNSEGALRIESPYLPSGHIEQTADGAKLEADGRFELLGRLDRIVKLEEKRISLPMLEQALASHPWVHEARLGVVQDNRAYLGALVALSDAGLHALRNQGRRTLTGSLRQHLSQHCAALALPRRWRLVRQLPLNAQGKLPQAELERLLYAPRTLQPQLLSQRFDAGQWRLELEVPLDLAHFTGHFPHTPILPGVVQIDWALTLAQQLMCLPPRFAGMEVLKFQQLARPGDRLQLCLRFDAERGKLYFTYRSGAAACSSGRILLGDARA